MVLEIAEGKRRERKGVGCGSTLAICTFTNGHPDCTKTICRHCHGIQQYKSNTSTMTSHMIRHHYANWKDLNLTKQIIDNWIILIRKSSYMITYMLSSVHCIYLIDIIMSLVRNISCAMYQIDTPYTHKTIPVPGGASEAKRKQTSAAPSAVRPGVMTLGKHKQSSLTATAEYCVMDMHPVWSTESQGFRHILSVLEPLYQPVSHGYVKEKFVIPLHHETRDLVMKDISTGTRHAFTANVWSSMANEEYVKMTCNYIDPKTMELESRALDTKCFKPILRKT